MTAAKTKMTDQHKEALAQGRTDGHAVRRYLEALEAHKPRRGRPFNPADAERQLRTIDEEMSTGGLDALSRLQLAQRRLDLQERLGAADLGASDLDELEAAFVKAAAPYSERKGITYSAWRLAGVSPAVLKKAGIRRVQ